MKVLITSATFGLLITCFAFSHLNGNVVVVKTNEQLLNYLPGHILSPYWAGSSVCVLCTAEQPFHGHAVQKPAVLGGAGDCFVCCWAPFLIPQAPVMPAGTGWGRGEARARLGFLCCVESEVLGGRAERAGSRGQFDSLNPSSPCQECFRVSSDNSNMEGNLRAKATRKYSSCSGNWSWVNTFEQRRGVTAGFKLFFNP